MTFTTLTFVLFLAIVFSLYWLIGKRTPQNLLLLVASYGFYAWWDWRFCWLMLASSLIDYFGGLLVYHSKATGKRRLFLALSMIANLGMLCYFKYFNFFADSFVVLANKLGWNVDPIIVRVVLPVGISFYTFQTMSYTIDVYFGKLTPTRRIIDYLAYVCFFPQLVAGPIERGGDLLPQFFVDRKFDEATATDGCRQILWGFFKKMVIADRLAIFVTHVYGPGPGTIGIANASGPQIAFATIAFAYQIYCDFSAYSDIAIGTGKLFGFRLSRNFAYPYLSRSPAEFWRRWHITLSTWFRDYIFIPLGGSRGGKWRTARNLLIAFGLSGLWHGASWNFVLWGLLMGGVLALGVLLRPARTAPHTTGDNVIAPTHRATVADVPGGEGWLPSWRSLGAILATFTFVCAGWVLFRTATMKDAGRAFGAIFSDALRPQAYVELWLLIKERNGTNALLAIGTIVVIEWFTRRRLHPLAITATPRPVRWALYSFIGWATIMLAPRTVSPFIYFQF